MGNVGKICCIEGCTNKITKGPARGMCGTHYARFLKYGDPLEPSHWAPKKKGKCSVSGCQDLHYGRGYCNRHWRQWNKYGRILPPITCNSLPGEVWRQVSGTNGCYEVSSLGRVKSLYYRGSKETSLLTPYTIHGYKRLQIRRFGKRISIGVHRLVAEAFLPNPENKPEVNHINGDKEDNRAENLEWVTSSENTTHAYRVLGYKATGGRPKRKIKNLDTGKVYDSISEAVADGFRRSSLIACCQGRYHTAGGYHWKYL